MNQGGADLFFLLSLPPFSSFLHLFFFISYLTYPCLSMVAAAVGGAGAPPAPPVDPPLGVTVSIIYHNKRVYISFIISMENENGWLVEVSS